MRKFKLLMAGALGALVLLVVLGLVMASAPAALAGPGDPSPGTVVGIRTYTFYPTTAITGNGTLYSSSPRYYSGLDMTWTRNWHSADVFVTTDVSGTASVTVTAQYSPDASNWTDAEFLSEGWVLPLSYSATITNSSGVTNTTTSTHTYSFSGSTASRSSSWVKYRSVQSADGTEFYRLPTTGEYLRFKIEYTGTLTLTVKATLRND